MGNCENCQGNGIGTVFKTVSILLLLVIAVLLGVVVYNNTKLDSLQSSEQTISSSFEKVPTVEEALAIRASQLEAWRCESVYAEIPSIIMQALYEKLGTQESIKTYVYEYEANEEKYINMYVAKEAELTIDKETAKKIDKIEVKTKLKEPENKTEKMAITTGDSIE